MQNLSNPAAFWDDRYQSEDYAYGTTPNLYFKQQLALASQPGKLLLLAEGEGRNAVYAAACGWQVTAVDFSRQAREKALALAEKQGVSIDYHISNVQDFDFDAFGPWDAIGLIFAHLPPQIRPMVHANCSTALASGGLLILEGFNPRQLSYRHISGGPGDPAMLYTTSLLQSDWPHLAVLDMQETVVVLEEGVYHAGQAEVVRFTGQKN